MKSQNIAFTNDEGLELSARLTFPLSQKPKAFVLFAHCFTCSKDLHAVRNIGTSLNQKGFAVFSFDFTGLGKSEGKFSETNFSSNVNDLVSAANYMEQEFESPKLIIGHSLGGSAAIFAGAEIDSVEAIATIGSPSDPSHVSNLFSSNIDEIKEKGLAQVNIGGRSFTIQNQFIEDIKRRNLKDVLTKLRKAILVMHSPQDSIVNIANAAEIYGNAMHPKSFVSLDGADHLLGTKKDSEYAGNVIATWASRYLNLPKEVSLSTAKQVIAQTEGDSYTTDILAGNHSLRADEPESVGGNDFGPTPYDLLLSALGACTSMTLRMYADRKKWDLQAVEVHLSHSKEHAQDCGDCENSSSKIDLIQREIRMEGDLSTEQRQRLLEIADKCPVHKTLHNTIKVNTVAVN